VADEFDELLEQIIYKADRRDRGVGLPSVGLQSIRPRTETGLPIVNRPPYLGRLLPFRVEIGIVLSLATVFAATAAAPLG
jgi:hypothetical protein